MMKTSYYARFSRLSKEEKDRYMPILISSSLPKWFLDREEYYMEYKPLAPSSDNVFKLKNNKILKNIHDCLNKNKSEIINNIQSINDLFLSVKKIIDSHDQFEFIYSIIFDITNYIFTNVIRRFF